MGMDSRTRAAAAITEAKAELDRALAEIDQIKTLDPALLAVVAHALSNYVTITSATVEMLQLTLRGHPDPDVPIWLEGIGHTADLIQHTVGRLVALGAPRDMPLKLDYVNLPILMERACQYHRTRTQHVPLTITCETVGQVPLVWADRVAVAVIADNVLSNAVQVSSPSGTIAVQIASVPGYVACSVRDAGPGLSRDEQEGLFQPQPSGAEPGKGIGLAVAHDFVERMDGDIRVENGAERGGACLTFRLPAVE